MGFAGNYADSKIDKLPSGNDSWLFTVYGAPPSYDLVGTPYNQEGTNGKYRQISYRRGAVGKNPYWVLENSSYREATKRFFGNGYLEFVPASWVSIRYQLGVDQYTTDNAEYTEMGQGDLPTAAQYPTPNNPVYAYVAPTGGIIDNYGVTRRVVNSLLTATFSHNFSDNLKGNLVVGNEIDHNHSEFYRSNGNNFTTPGWKNLANTNIKNSSYNTYNRRTAGFFGNLNLDYMNMFYFNLTGRQDIVSSMPRDNRTFFYHSTSLAFVFTELDALQDNKILSFGKARISYAQFGQSATEFLADPSFVQVVPRRLPYQCYCVSLAGLLPLQIQRNTVCSDLKPRIQTHWNSFEVCFLNNRIGLDYKSPPGCQGQIIAFPLAGSTGFAQMSSMPRMKALVMRSSSA
jgi:hypothetical protein